MCTALSQANEVNTEDCNRTREEMKVVAVMFTIIGYDVTFSWSIFNVVVTSKYYTLLLLLRTTVLVLLY